MGLNAQTPSAAPSWWICDVAEMGDVYSTASREELSLYATSVQESIAGSLSWLTETALFCSFS